MKNLLSIATLTIFALSSAAFAKPVDKKYHPFVGNDASQEAAAADAPKKDADGYSDLAPAAGKTQIEDETINPRQFKRH